jgi:uncharacterized protein DUF3268
VSWFDVGFDEAGPYIDQAAARRRAHEAFDSIWHQALPRQQQGARSICYSWLAFCMGKLKQETHMAQFGLEDCARVVAICEGKSWGSVLEWHRRCRVESKSHKEN